MGCNKSKNYIAKETYHPYDNEWEGFTTQSYEESRPLRIECGQKLKMIDRETGLVAPDRTTTLYRMRYADDKRNVGLVPSNLVAESGSLECEVWYYGRIGRRKTEDILGTSVNIKGSFIVRLSDHRSRAYALSVKSFNSQENKFVLKHYLIKHNEAKTKFWVKGQENYKYSSLKHVIDMCRKHDDRGLACRLTEPGRRPRQQNVRSEGGEWETNRSELKKEKKLGSGNYGVVYKGKWRGTVDVAIKQLKNMDENRMIGRRAIDGFQKAREEFFKESHILRILHHPHLVQVYAICTHEEPFWMILEYCDNGSLKDFLKNAERKRHVEEISFDKLIMMSENIASGMSELVRLGIVHRDLAARNVMVDKWLQAKVGDFGLAREGAEYKMEEEDEDGDPRKIELPWRWTAPEAIEYKQFTHNSDVWAFGITLWEMFTFCQTPYLPLSNAQVVEQIKIGLRLPKPNYSDTEPKLLQGIYNLMLECWNENPRERPSFETLQSDLDEFGPTLLEGKYNYNTADYMKTHRMTNTPRDQAIRERRRRAK